MELIGLESFEKWMTIIKQDVDCLVQTNHMNTQTADVMQRITDNLLVMIGMYEQLKQTHLTFLRELQINASITELAKTLISTANIEDISCLILDRAKQVTDSKFGFVGFIDQDTNDFISITMTKGIWHQCEIENKTVVFHEKKGLWGWVLQNKKPLMTNDPSKHPHSTGIPDGHISIERFLSVPAIVGDELMGQIALANSTRNYTDNDLFFLQRMAYLYALAIQRQRSSDELVLAKQEAEKANHAKSLFIASVSHEFRTPLNSILGFSEVLQDEYFGKLNPRQAQYVDNIHKSGSHLLALINQVLDISKIEAGKLELSRLSFQFKTFLTQCLAMVQDSAEKKNIELSMEIPDALSLLEIKGDESRLKQVMFNLLSNAIKFTPDGGWIEISIFLSQLDLIVYIQDTGIGLSVHEQSKIFTEFYQSKSKYNEKLPGTGLGLSIAKRIVEFHGGRIWMHSKGVKKGSCFCFTLPVNPA
ncbi:MAG: GAF domain-containing protein [Desulfobacterales bacterium]|nr:GAF domain-containing protein [Desulfobacterales bacterium]